MAFSSEIFIGAFHSMDTSESVVKTFVIESARCGESLPFLYFPVDPNQIYSLPF